MYAIRSYYELQYVYLDSGAMYRAVALYALRKGVITSYSIHYTKLYDAVLFDGELSDEGLQYLDDQIANLDSNTLQTIDRMIVQIV